MKHKFIFLFIGILIFLQLVSAVESDKTYVFRIVKDGFYVNPQSLELFDSPFSESSNLDSGDYTAKLVNSDGDALYSVKFDLYSLAMTNPTEECFANPEDPSCEEELYIYDDSYVDIILNFPYFRNANAINVYGSEGLIFSYRFKNPSNIFVEYWYYFAIGVAILLLLFVVFFLTRKRPEVTRVRGFQRNYPVRR